jgi:hypothetical protein
MSDEKALAVQEETFGLGAIQVAGPSDVIRRATLIANELAKIVKDKRLYVSISNRQFVRVEGWATLGAMLGVLPREVSVTEKENGDFEAQVELVRANDGAIIGRGSAIVGADESTWAKRPRYARRSMAITRATGKAYRLGFAWIMTLAGYEPTPAEEMDGIIEAEVIGQKPSSAPQSSAEGNGGNDGEKPLDFTNAPEFLAWVNERVQVPYDNLFHLRAALAQEGLEGKSWPDPRRDPAWWQTAKDAAIRHAEAKAIEGTIG